MNQVLTKVGDGLLAGIKFIRFIRENEFQNMEKDIGGVIAG